MKVSKLNNLLRPNRVYRGIAVFFLLFTLADLTFSGFCCDEFTDLGPSAQTLSLTDTMTLVDAGERNQRSEPQSQSGALEEDCFCCCIHILPVTAQDSSGIAVIQHQYSFRPANLSIAWLNGTDHPPRSASC
ncbi:MAG TPA: hypothetical protein VGB07_21250 [Blastocatellia bacterium]|jgi:hypothetical protein|nr:hypothetical protein [Nitrosomonas nitrosa]